MRLRDAPTYLGMDRNRFNSEVRPLLIEIAAAYAQLKSELAMSHGKRDYTEAKGPFIESVIATGPES